MSTKPVAQCTDQEILEYAAGLGYSFTLEDCHEIKHPASFVARLLPAGETLEQAVNDYLDAFER
jgi:hypothetical protein